MKIEITSASQQLELIAVQLATRLTELGFLASTGTSAKDPEENTLVELIPGKEDLIDYREGKFLHRLGVADLPSLLERTLRVIPLDFERLPLLIEGESKQVRLWTDKVVVTRFKPTVYSYTMNRNGEAPGTEVVRLKFSAELFRRMARLDTASRTVSRTASRGFQNEVEFTTAFLAERHTPDGPLLVQRKVESSNLEVRVKRYHIGSPLHRYLYAERYPTVQQTGEPLRRWTRLDYPVVCFDWRNPLQDEAGHRLADEPLSDDYAGIWMENVAYAKTLARQTFLWLEELFAKGGVCLVDFCLLIDRTGRIIYGEISPDCMRVRLDLINPARAEEGAKDVWRAGGSPEQLYHHYEELYQRIFETSRYEAPVEKLVLSTI
ncbi:MAG: hypothetical protein HXX20_08600 [Chloroflexi bacterium]|nr:hypothetical protein [Chloroflexota bacterium]